LLIYTAIGMTSRSIFPAFAISAMQVVNRLQIQPGMGITAKITGEPHGGVRSDSTAL